MEAKALRQRLLNEADILQNSIPGRRLRALLIEAAGAVRPPGPYDGNPCVVVPFTEIEAAHTFLAKLDEWEGWKGCVVDEDGNAVEGEDE